MATLITDLALEDTWNKFLRSLNSHELSYIMPHELEIHDEFIMGVMTIEEIRDEIEANRRWGITSLR